MPWTVEQKRAHYAANREAYSAKNAALYAVNRERIREQQNAARATDPEREAERCADYYRRNREKVKATAKRWREANPEKVRLANAAKKARRRGMPLTDEAKCFLPVVLADPCAYCGGEGGTLDHITALAAGGDGDVANLTGACFGCNVSKKATPLLLFLRRRRV